MPKGSYRPIFQQVSSTAEDFSPHVAPVRNSENKPRVDEEERLQTPPMLPDCRTSPWHPDRLYRISHIMLIANVCMILFTLIFGTRVMLDIDRINQRMELFQSFWTKHLTAKVE